MYNKELAIAAQSAGAQAATIFAALIGNADTPAELLTFENYDQWRNHIYEGTLALADTDDGPSVQSREYKAGGGMTCPHGTRVVRTGTNAKGKWTGHFCPLDREDPDRCEPIFK